MKLCNEWYERSKFGTEQEDRTYHRNHRKRASYQLALGWVNGFKNCSSILDVGCSSLGFLGEVEEHFTTRTGIDIYKPAFMGFTNEEIEFIHGDFSEENVGVFDVVVALEVIEHIRPDLRRSFAQKLLFVSRKHLVFSIPYQWKNSPEPIPHDGFNESNIMEWFWDVQPDEHRIIHGHYIGHFIK